MFVHLSGHKSVNWKIPCEENINWCRSFSWKVLENENILTAWKVCVFRVILIRIHFECGKMRIKITPNTDTFTQWLRYRGVFWTLLTLSWRRPLSYRNQSIDLQSKSMDWFLYGNGLRHERVKHRNMKLIAEIGDRF